MIDFDKNNLPVSDYLPKVPMSMHRLSLSNSKAVQFYLSESKTKIEDYKIVPRMKKIFQLSILFLTPIEVQP